MVEIVVVEAVEEKVMSERKQRLKRMRSLLLGDKFSIASVDELVGLKHRYNKKWAKREAQLTVGREVMKYICPLIDFHATDSDRFSGDRGWKRSKTRIAQDRTRDLLIRILRELGCSTTVIGVCVHRDHSTIVRSLQRTQPVPQIVSEKTDPQPISVRSDHTQIAEIHSS